MTAFIRVCAVWLVVSASVVGAQEVPVQPGAKIRFQTAADSSFRSGELARLTSDSLVLSRCNACAGRLLYSRSELTRLDVFRRLPAGSRILTGFGIGGLIGLAAGALSGVGCHGDGCEVVLLAVPFGGILGGFIGGLAGYLSSYKWEPIALPHRQ